MSRGRRHQPAIRCWFLQLLGNRKLLFGHNALTAIKTVPDAITHPAIHLDRQIRDDRVGRPLRFPATARPLRGMTDFAADGKLMSQMSSLNYLHESLAVAGEAL